MRMAPPGISVRFAKTQSHTETKSTNWTKINGIKQIDKKSRGIIGKRLTRTFRDGDASKERERDYLTPSKSVRQSMFAGIEPG
jgi:hypothetical protein